MSPSLTQSCTSSSRFTLHGTPWQWPGRPWVWRFIALTVLYISLVTADVMFGPVPLKFLLCCSAVIAWSIDARARGTLRQPLAAPVALAAVVVPLAWLGVAAIGSASGDPAQPNGMAEGIEQANRFVYLLLYFPMADMARAACVDGGVRLWLIPVMALAAITWLLAAGHAAGIDYGFSGTVGPFRGAIGVDPTGSLRVYLINDVLFIPALALLCAAIRCHGLRGATLVCLVLTVGAVYLSRTRGIWLGVLVAVAAILLLYARTQRRVPTSMSAGAWVLVLVALVMLAAPQVPRDLVGLNSPGQELSARMRISQGPELLKGFEASPLIGEGMGATLPSGHRTSQGTPWTYELLWLQLLFQLGAAGLACFLLAPLMALGAALRSLSAAGEAPSARVLGGAAGLVGVGFASATNPYLTTSPGMMALAVLMALCVAGSAPSRSAASENA